MHTRQTKKMYYIKGGSLLKRHPTPERLYDHDTLESFESLVLQSHSSSLKGVRSLASVTAMEDHDVRSRRLQQFSGHEFFLRKFHILPDLAVKSVQILLE